MLADSRLLHDLEQFAFNPAGQPLCVYGNPAYPLRIHLQGPFEYGVLTPQMEEYNHRMSAIRSSVEWLFGDVVNSFKFNDFKKNLKLFLNSVGKMYVVSVILRNALTCLYGNLTNFFWSHTTKTWGLFCLGNGVNRLLATVADTIRYEANVNCFGINWVLLQKKYLFSFLLLDSYLSTCIVVVQSWL